MDYNIDELKEIGIRMNVPDHMPNFDMGISAKYKIQTMMKSFPKKDEELRIYRQYVPILIMYTEDLENAFQHMGQLVDRFQNPYARTNKRWTSNEDNYLIEMICDDESIFDISMELRRTVPSIKTRLSYLVGIKRLSQKVAGKFIGEINGEQTEAELIGTVYRR